MAENFIIITGLSGAGKSEAVRCFEDLGYFCVDNLPSALIPKFAELYRHSAEKVGKVALVSDIRGGKFFDSLEDSLSELERIGFGYEILFLEASDEALVRRFKETRRRHPLAPDGAIIDAIAEERERLEELRGRAARIIDTSGMSSRALHQEIRDLYGGEKGDRRLRVTVVSFGFKYGIPLDADMVLDVRFLPNPQYVSSLKAYSGRQEEVAEYVFKWPITQQFVEKTFDLLAFLMPQFVTEGKAHFVLAVGCTGGRHRSVALAERYGAYLEGLGYTVGINHRDVERVADGSSSTA